MPPGLNPGSLAGTCSGWADGSADEACHTSARTNTRTRHTSHITICGAVGNYIYILRGVAGGPCDDSCVKLSRTLGPRGADELVERLGTKGAKSLRAQ